MAVSRQGLARIVHADMLDSTTQAQLRIQAGGSAVLWEALLRGDASPQVLAVSIAYRNCRFTPVIDMRYVSIRRLTPYS